MKKYYLSLFLSVLTLGVFGQSYYQLPFINAGSNPGNLNNDPEQPEGFLSANATGYSNVLSSSAADAWSTAQTIPFSFNFNGSPETTYYVSTSGVVTFASSAPVTIPGFTPSILPAATIPPKSICAWGVDLTGANDAVVSKTFGTAPNRQHWIIWASASSSALGTGWTYWGIVFEETTNVIHIVDMRSYSQGGGNLALTAGIQIDGSTAINVAGSPSLTSQNTATGGSQSDALDNTYYSFIYGVQPQYDFTAIGSSVPQYYDLTNAPFSLDVDLRNIGSAGVATFDLNYSVNGGATVTAPATGAGLTSLASGNYIHPTAWTPTAAGSYSIELWASNLNGNPDANTANDKYTVSVTVVDTAATRQTLMEVFTASSCPPCKPGNENMDLNVVPNISNYTIVKYQQDFPGSGDPYQTVESVNRRNYYAINSIPRMEIDGQWDGNAQSLTTGIFNDYQVVPAFMYFNFNEASISNTTVNIDFDIEVLADYPAGNYRTQVAIIEKRTTGNVANNGETEFFNVMMDMVPNENGTPVTGLTKGNTINVTKTADVSSTFVEDLWELKVVVWVEETGSKMVMNSAWADITQLVSLAETDANAASIYPNPANDVLNIELDEQKDMTVKIYDMTGKLVLDQSFGLSAQQSINMSGFAPGVYNVQVIADGRISSKRITVAH